MGSFDHLVFTAGETLQIGAIADTDLDAARRALDVRVRGAYAAAKHAVPYLWREMSEEDCAAMYDSLSEALPVGRVGEVSDIAETFLYLMRNGYSGGTIVTVDGGSVLV